MTTSTTQVDALLLEAIPEDIESSESMLLMRRWARHLAEITKTRNLAALIRARSPRERWREACALEARSWRPSA